MFATALNQQIKLKNSRVCVGLDPRLEWLPEKIKNEAIKEYGRTFEAAGKAIEIFNKEVIDVVTPYTAIVKLQIASFEQYGPDGLVAFWNTVRYAHEKGLQVVVDAKRGDIGITAQAYANSLLGKINLFGKEEFCYDADSMTVNPFLGEDSMQPFIETAKKYGKGIFILVKTSNPGSKDIQDLKFNNGTISEMMATWVEKYAVKNLDQNGYSGIGAVLGATFPEEAKVLRKKMPHSIFLVPGFGSQGADLSGVGNFFNNDGLGAIITSSREIVFSDKGKEQNKYLEIIENKTKAFMRSINKELGLLEK
jgi:orotidine-5'-phosphate decarboxylase